MRNLISRILISVSLYFHKPQNLAVATSLAKRRRPRWHLPTCRRPRAGQQVGIRSRSDGSGSRRGEELIYPAAAPVKVGLYKRGASQEKLGSGRSPGALLLRRGVRRTGFIKNTSVTARKQMAGPVLLRPCGHSSFAFVRVRPACSLFIILWQSLPGPSPTAWGRAKHQGYFILVRKKGEKSTLKVLLSFFFPSSLFFFYQVRFETKFISFTCVRERAAGSLRHCVEDEAVRQGGVACVRVCVWVRVVGGVLPARLRSLI